MRGIAVWGVLILAEVLGRSAGAAPPSPAPAASPAPAPTAPASAAAPPVVPAAAAQNGKSTAPAAGAQNGKTPAPAAPPRDAEADPRQGIVRLERGERTLGFGFVLRGDGRILGSLSTIGNGNFVRVRFADGHVLPARVVATQRAWDLALLAPEGGHWTLGLRASVLDAAAEGVHLRRFGGRGRPLQESPANITGKQTLLGRDGALLRDALLLSGHFGDDELGSPLCDEHGEVVAVVGQACDPHVRQECRPAAFGVPVSALKQFLSSAPSREPLPAAWLGLRGVASYSGSVAGVRVIAIEPGSPAERAGLQVPAPNGHRTNADPDELSGDVIVAVNDLPVTTPEELRDLINRIVLTGAERAAERGAAAASAATSNADGEQHVRLLVYGSGRFRQTDLPLVAPQQLPAAAGATGKPAAPTSEGPAAQGRP